MPTRVTVEKKAGRCCRATATVVLSIKPTDLPFDIKSNIDRSTEHLVLDENGVKHEGYPYQAWESACHSGLLYAHRKIGCSNIEAIIESVSGRLGKGDAGGFAVAAEVALICELSVPVEYSARDLQGWVVFAVEKVPTETS